MNEQDKLPVALSYFFMPLWIVPLIIFLIKKDDSDTVKFLILQSLTVSVLLLILWISLSIFSVIPILGALVAFLVGPLAFLATLVYGIVLGVQILNKGTEPEIPMISTFVRNSLM